MLSLSGCKCQRDAARRGAAALCPMHNAEVLIIMVMRGEIRYMQMQGSDGVRVRRRARTSESLGPEVEIDRVREKESIGNRPLCEIIQLSPSHHVVHYIHRISIIFGTRARSICIFFVTVIPYNKLVRRAFE